MDVRVNGSARGRARADAQGRGDGAGSGESADPSQSRSLCRGVFHLPYSLVKLLSGGLGRVNAKIAGLVLPGVPFEAFSWSHWQCRWRVTAREQAVSRIRPSTCF